ncbi:unnamed protein product [Caenorhabditis nigoni]
MCSTFLSVDSRRFYIVDHLEPMTQIIIMSFVNMVSVFVNVVMFYVTLRSSKNESMTYRIVSFAHNFSLFLAQLYWGLIMNPIPLLPLPGIQSIGILRGIISTFMILITWIFLFSVSIIMMYVIMLIRLRTLARKNNIFDNLVRFSFLAIAPAIVLRNTFLPPERDTIAITLFANAMFTAAPIPCAIVILAQNSTYMNFLKSKMIFYNRRIPATANISSAFRHTTVL